MNIIIVNLIGAGLIALIVWYFWLSKPQATIAAAAAGRPGDRHRGQGRLLARRDPG